MENGKKHLWIIVPFITIISSIGLINELSLDKTESSAENRTLQQRPGIQNIINKDYSSIYETYYTDQFIGRDKLLKLYTELEVAMGKSTVRNHYIVDDEWILPRNIAKKSSEEIQEYANTFNSFVNSIKNENRDVFYVSTPAKSIALNFMYPIYAEKSYGMDNLNEFISLLDNNLTKSINIDEHFKNNFSNEELKSFYFKTDHHWNGQGAFEGFKYLMKNTDYLSDEQYNNIFETNKYVKYIQKDKLFLGSYNRNLFSIFDEHEEIPYIYNKENQNYKFFNYNGIEYVPMDENLIINTERNLEEVTYGGSYTYDLPLYKVINEDAPIKKKLLIVRDSFQAPTTLMFSDMFETVEILDPRNTMDLTASKVISESNPDAIMFMFHSETFETMVNMMK